jgi:DNA-binding winged helix-turn-helix (wHTH) protein/Tol biopolymer transport system component
MTERSKIAPVIGLKSFRVGDWVVDRSLNQMARPGSAGEPATTVRLEPKAMEVLAYLAERAGEVVDKDSVIQEVWGGAFVSNEVLTNAIWEIRRALGDDRQTSVFIQTIPKRGYRLVAPVSLPDTAAPGHGARSSTLPLPLPLPLPLRLGLGLGGLVAALAAVAALSLWLRPSGPVPGGRSVTRFTVDAVEPLGSMFLPAIAMSPDGSTLVYATAHSGLFARRIDRMESTLIPGTEGGQGPFFSPDGSAVGFFAGTKLRTSKLDGTSPPTDLADVGAPRGACWGSDGFVYFTYGSNAGLWRIPAAGGAAEALTELDASAGEWTHRWPEVLPGARTVLFTVARGEIQSFDDASVEALDLRTRQRRVIVDKASFPRYVEGKLLFVRGADVLAVSFDERSLAPEGAPISVAKDVRLYPINGAAQFSVSREGSLVYVPARADAEVRYRLSLVDRTGVRTQVLDDARLMYDPAVSRDGSKIAMSIVTSGNSDLWVYDVRRATLTRFTASSGEEEHPVFSRDGLTLAYDYAKAGPFRMFARRVDGSDEERPLDSDPTSSGGEIPESYAPDGTLVFSTRGPQTGLDLWTLRPGEDGDDGDRHPLLAGPFDECYPSVSPDGRSLAFSSNESGRLEVYLTTFPVPGARLQLSADGGGQPAWTRSGKEVVFLGREGILAVPVETSPTLSAGRPRKLFDWTPPAPTLEGSYRNQFDVAPDGDRFALVDSPDDAPTVRLNVVLSWTAEIARGSR